jgi:hypothetical protein
MQDRCTVCIECTIGSKIILDAPDGTRSDVGHVESQFFLFRDSVIVGARSVHGLHQTYLLLRNRYGVPNGTLRWRGSSESSVSFNPNLDTR